jgi:hypothetical protein
MHLVAIGWMYVVLMMAIAEAVSSQGTLLGAVFTVLLYGVLPLAIVLYILGTPARKRALRAAEQNAPAPATASPPGATPAPPPPRPSVPPSASPDGRGHAAGGTITPEREEP